MRKSDRGRVRPHELAALILNFVLIYLGCTGLFQAFSAHGTRVFIYYTYDSNLLGVLSEVCYAVFLLGKFVRPNRTAPAWVRFLRFSSAAAMEVTFLTVAFLFVPSGLFTDAGVSGSAEALLFSGDALYMHFICPLLNLVTFLFFEWDPPLRFRDTLYALLFTVIYTAILIVLNVRGILTGPYSFFHVYEQPVSVSVLLAVGMLGANYLITCCNWAVNRAMGRSY